MFESLAIEERPGKDANNKICQFEALSALNVANRFGGSMVRSAFDCDCRCHCAEKVADLRDCLKHADHFRDGENFAAIGNFHGTVQG